jgi:outer membrane protein TolC
VRAAQAEAQAAAAESRVARSQTRPQVSANTYLTYGDMPNNFYSSPGVMPSNILTVPHQGQADQNLTLMVPIYTGGRLHDLVRAAGERERAASAEIGGVQAETALRIKDAYYRTQLAEENGKVAQARFDAATELVRTTRTLFEAGKGLEASVRRVEAEQADAQRNLTTARNEQAKALLDLKAAMGVRLDSDITLTDALTFAPPEGDVSAQLAEAAKTRPELLAAQARFTATRHQTSAARGAQGPQVYGMAMADGFTSNQMGTRGGYSLGVVVSIPLLDAGERRAEAAGMQAMQERAEAELRDLEQRVASEVRQAWLDVETAAANYRTAQTAVQAAQAAYEVTVVRVQNQRGLLVEQLDALAALTQARGSLAQALYEHTLAVARLRRAVGRP